MVQRRKEIFILNMKKAETTQENERSISRNETLKEKGLLKSVYVCDSSDV